MTIKNIGPGLKEFLSGDAAINTAVAGRIFPERLPQNNRVTSIVYIPVSSFYNYTMSGPSHLVGPRYQIDCWAVIGQTALDLANLVKERIDGYRGTMGTGGNAIDVRGVFQTDDRSEFDELVQMYRVSRDYFIHYSET